MWASDFRFPASEDRIKRALPFVLWGVLEVKVTCRLRLEMERFLTGRKPNAGSCAPNSICRTNDDWPSQHGFEQVPFCGNGPSRRCSIRISIGCNDECFIPCERRGLTKKSIRSALLIGGHILNLHASDMPVMGGIQSIC